MRCIRNLTKNPKRVIYMLYIILIVYGLGLLAWGITDRIIDEDSSVMSFGICIGVGAIGLLNSAMGIYGTYVNDNCLVYTSIFLLFTSCVAQIMVTMIRITMPLKGADIHEKELLELFRREDEASEKKFGKLELELSCCGVYGPDDYEQKWDTSLVGYSATCCGKKLPKYQTCEAPNSIGCYESVMNRQHKEELLRAIIFLFSSVLKFFSANVIAVLTIWGDQF